MYSDVYIYYLTFTIANGCCIAAANHLACLPDETYLKSLLLTYRGLRKALGTGSNWCQGEAMIYS